MKKRVRSIAPSQEVLHGLPNLENIVQSLESTYPSTKQDFKVLVKAGADPHMLRLLLLELILWFAWGRSQTVRSAPPGMEWHTLKRFPARLNHLAKTIEQVNAHTFLSPSRHMPYRRAWKTEAVRKRMAHEFEKLPGVLRWYAAYIEGQSAFLGRFARRGGFNFQKWWQIRMLDFIRHSTGKFYFERVARLLTATSLAAGRKKGISPQALKLLWKRNPLFHPVAGKS